MTVVDHTLSQEEARELLTPLRSDASVSEPPRTGSALRAVERAFKAQINTIRLREELGHDEPVSAERIAEFDRLDELFHALMEVVEPYRPTA